MEKVIVVDYNIFAFRGLFAWRNQKDIPLEYIILNMLLSALTKIGVTPFTKILIAQDGRGNWRKKYTPEYKANRKEFRESFEDLNWTDIFEKFNKVINWIDEATDWHIIQLDEIEADDIASVACRKYKGKEVILCSYDSDWQLLWHYPNVKIFSILKKYKGGRKGAYKIPPARFNAYKLLASKIKEEKTDNLTSPVLSEKDYMNRQTVVNLLELPEYIEGQIVKELNNLQPKENTNIEKIPFQSIQKRINELYNANDKVITYEDCVIYEQKKKKRKKRRKK